MHSGEFEVIKDGLLKRGCFHFSLFGVDFLFNYQAYREKIIASYLQVIRRGDRRPFYAPAKYVVELRPEDVPASEMMASPGGHHPNLNFSTFGPLKGKRSSYAPASGSSGVMLIPPPASSLETSGRLNDR